MSISKENIIDAISKMSITDVNELISMLEKKFNVIASSINSNVTSNTEVKEEQTEFSIFLDKIGINKISVIKIVRSITGLGLKEAKDLVESAPILIKESLNKVDAESIKQDLEKVGATITIK
ncbi:MAG: 50S ribosomal protein L7/L12 [Candidatus Lightella neohaematopini]|nr:50S ribosomal protein L7/L12 [Candidatus Lightella neohaematopini]